MFFVQDFAKTNKTERDILLWSILGAFLGYILSLIVSFIKECYTDTGNPIDKEFEKKIDKPCDWCDFGKNKDLCGASLTPDEKFFSF